jgi:hypothetical protein
VETEQKAVAIELEETAAAFAGFDGQPAPFSTIASAFIRWGTSSLRGGQEAPTRPRCRRPWAV